MYCNYCRQSNPDDSNYCRACGRTIKVSVDRGTEADVMVAPSKGGGTPRASAPLTVVSPCQNEAQGVPEYKLELAKFSDEDLKELRTTFEELRIQPSQALRRELEQRFLNDCVTEKGHVESPPSQVESREKLQPLSHDQKESYVHGRSSGNSSAPVPSNVRSELSVGLKNAEVENSSSTTARPIPTSSLSPKQRTPAAAMLDQQSPGASAMGPRGPYKWIKSILVPTFNRTKYFATAFFCGFFVLYGKDDIVKNLFGDLFVWLGVLAAIIFFTIAIPARIRDLKISLWYELMLLIPFANLIVGLILLLARDVDVKFLRTKKENEILGFSKVIPTQGDP